MTDGIFLGYFNNGIIECSASYIEKMLAGKLRKTVTFEPHKKYTMNIRLRIN